MCPRCGCVEYTHPRFRMIVLPDGEDGELRRCARCKRVYAVRLRERLAT